MTPPTPTSSSRLDWLLFVLLGFLWGSSYLFIKIGIDAGLAAVHAGLPPPALRVRAARGRGRASHASRCRASRASSATSSCSGSSAWRCRSGSSRGRSSSVDSSLAAVLTGAVPALRHPLRRAPAARGAHHLQRPLGIAIGLVGVAIVVGFDPASLAGERARGRARAHRRGRFVCHRRRVRASQRPRPAPDDPGAVPGRLRAGDDRRSWRSSSSSRGRTASLPMRSSPSSGSACSARARRTWSSSGCWATGAPPAPRWSPTCCRSGASSSARWCCGADRPRLVLGTALVISGIALVNQRRSLRTTFRRDQTAVTADQGPAA